MKKKVVYGIGSFLLLSIVVIFLGGLLPNQNDQEQPEGLSSHFDVSAQGTIAYVEYTEGKPVLSLYNQDLSIEAKVLELEVDQMILDPAFSTDGATLVFVSTLKDAEMELKSRVHLLDLRTKKVKELFSRPSIITELEFSPQGTLFYLSAETFQNYSPIASKRPHDFDLYEYRLENNEHLQRTNLKKYAMRSLEIPLDEKGKSVFVQMDDDADVKTAEDSFDVQQRVFRIPLEDPTTLEVVSDPDREVDIFDFALFPNGKEMVYQSISNAKSGDTFQYELYRYNMVTKEEQQLTHLKEYASNPVISANVMKIYLCLIDNLPRKIRIIIFIK